MGRKKIKIQTISNDRQRNVTFARRRCGLIKKAHELAVLCESKVALLMFDAKDTCHFYSSEKDHDELIRKYYYKDFRTLTRRSQDSSKYSHRAAAVIHQYTITTDGDGSEHLHPSSELSHYSSEPTTPIECSYPQQQLFESPYYSELLQPDRLDSTNEVASLDSQIPLADYTDINYRSQIFGAEMEMVLRLICIF
ncbi:SRF-like protein [Basidiobolus meristosporus CBS 931.73]|uniref:SRF-like protein n=1 Tax=Basidiobolus meristosporus CBS 931.73 TaxID=1314790 RepID=A0A1Y1XS99_9FUNG|nr:SRF-like protein [Basidiobolus meristosporus CBS 931.73]|eukprot:ORX88555.1 SRF-like protein [Basidiobolus meristosporus CBS 931.73]